MFNSRNSNLKLCFATPIKFYGYTIPLHLHNPKQQYHLVYCSIKEINIKVSINMLRNKIAWIGMYYSKGDEKKSFRCEVQVPITIIYISRDFLPPFLWCFWLISPLGCSCKKARKSENPTNVLNTYILTCNCNTGDSIQISQLH